MGGRGVEGRGAVFFDLDRTLLRGASGPVINRALRAAGLLSGRPYPGERATYALFDLVGETLPAIVLARGAALLAKGWDAEDVRAAGREAADELVRHVTPYALPLIQGHQAAGRPVVLATATPDHLVRPLAERLGFDDVVATRYAQEGGTFTGRLEGEFVWATGKRAAVAAWAADHRIDLASSYAYSDSVYDLPLLTAVGHPHAVNPDPRLLVAAAMARWPVLHLDVPPGVPKLLGLEPYDLLRSVARPSAIPFARFRFAGVEHVPRRGPGIVVAHHRSSFDPAALVVLAAQAGRVLRFLGPNEVFDAPLIKSLIGPVLRGLGSIQVGPGSGTEAPLTAAVAALAAGELLCVLLPGTGPGPAAGADAELVGCPEAARLAGRSGAPVIPVGLWGTEAVWPRRSKVPRAWNVLRPPEVLVRVGPPVPMGRADAEADTAALVEALVRLLPECSLATQPHTA